MSDLISRQAAIALSDKLKADMPDDDRIADSILAHNEGILEYQTALSMLPSAQPEIIRCKDCKHWDELLAMCKKSRRVIFGVKDFCSKAERRTDE